jgi:hypothetical protein
LNFLDEKIEMVERETAPDLELDGKEVEIQSLHSSSESSNHDRKRNVEKEGDVDVEKGRGGEKDEGEMRREENIGKESKGNGLRLKSVISRVSMRSTVKDPGPPPDGGWRAWSQGVFVFFS